MDRRGWKSTAAYVSLLAAAFVVAVLGSWEFGSSLDMSVYDEMFRKYQPPAWPLESMMLVIDERTIDAIPGGMSNIRGPLARGLQIVAAAKPKAVAVDVILAGPKEDGVDAQLTAAFRALPNLVLSSQLVSDGWED